MRFINLNGRSPNQAWLRKSHRLLQTLNAAADDAARSKIIEDNKEFWKELMPWLRKVTKGKCWFSESRGACQYWEVEHFRPKGAARNLDGTARAEGYWWLAFEWGNFRLCGGVTNRKKGYYFPLRGGTHIGTSGLTQFKRASGSVGTHIYEAPEQNQRSRQTALPDKDD